MFYLFFFLGFKLQDTMENLNDKKENQKIKESEHQRSFDKVIKNYRIYDQEKHCIHTQLQGLRQIYWERS